MSVFEALTLMLAFGGLVVSIMNSHNGKKK
ncbi:putative holin-like toxin [Listeria kieliensis]